MMDRIKPARGQRTKGGKFKNWLVSRGIKWICGTSSEVPAAAAADVPILSGGLRFAWLRFLAGIGRKNINSTSVFGHPFVCHIGDVAEFPFYHRRALAPELALCVEWMRYEDNLAVYDVGANVAIFISAGVTPDCVRISYSELNSLFSQVTDRPNYPD